MIFSGSLFLIRLKIQARAAEVQKLKGNAREQHRKCGERREANDNGSVKYLED